MDDLLARAQMLPQLLGASPYLQHRGRFANGAFLMEIGEVRFHAELRDGAFVDFAQGPALMRPWRFALRGDPQAWERFCLPCPPPDFHDILALTKFKRFQLEGDLHPFLSNLLFFKDLFALPRSPGGAL